jgi:hypothetical protein
LRLVRREGDPFLVFRAAGDDGGASNLGIVADCSARSFRLGALSIGVTAVPDSVLDAIRQGIWDFEPPPAESAQFSSTQALPGSDEKLAILAERVQQGLPLWHPSDRNHSLDSFRDD